MQIHDNLDACILLPPPKQKYPHLATEMLIQNLSLTIFTTYIVALLRGETKSYGTLMH
jgi:hypothetical protein